MTNIIFDFNSDHLTIEAALLKASEGIVYLEVVYMRKQLVKEMLDEFAHKYGVEHKELGFGFGLRPERRLN
jgi:hypothetical protein